MLKLRERIELSGRTYIVPVIGGEEDWERCATEHNVLLPRFKLALISQITSGAVLPPNKIYLGTGALAKYDAAGVPVNMSLQTSGAGVAYGQRFQSSIVGSTYKVKNVLLWMKRIGASAATVTVSIRSDTAGLPGAALGTSVAVAQNTISQSAYGWVLFNFATAISIAPATNYHVTLASSGYTYTVAVNEIMWGTKTVGAYAAGDFESYNGAAWSVPTAGKDAHFRVIVEHDIDSTQIIDSLIGRTMTSKSTQGVDQARLLSNFATTDIPSEYIGEVVMTDDDNNLLAVSTNLYSKDAATGLNVYWIITFGDC